jgi:hypothetical protein
LRWTIKSARRLPQHNHSVEPKRPRHHQRSTQLANWILEAETGCAWGSPVRERSGLVWGMRSEDSPDD